MADRYLMKQLQRMLNKLQNENEIDITRMYSEEGKLYMTVIM